MIDAAEYIPFLFRDDGLLEPGEGGLELTTSTRHAAAYLLQGPPEAFMIDPAVDIPLLFGNDCTLKPE